MKQTLALVCFGFCLSAQPPAEQKQAKVEGVVADANGAPLRGVLLRLVPNFSVASEQGVLDKLAPQPTVQSDNRGRFVFPDLPPALYHLNAEKPGYLTQTYGAKPGDAGANAGAPIEVRAGSDVSGLSLKLIEQAVIGGRVMTDAGEPLTGVPVDAVTWVYIDGRRRLEVRGISDITDEHGEFRITGLPPGQFFLYADSKPPGPPRPGLTNEGLFPTYYPNALDIAGATTVQLLPGGEGRADIRMRRDRVFTVRGTVTGPQAARAVTGAAIFLLRDDEGPFVPDRATARQTNAILPPLPYKTSVRTGPDGSFEIKGVLPGTHRLVAFGGTKFQLSVGPGRTLTHALDAGSRDDGANGGIDFTVRDEDVNGVEIRLQPAGTITLDFKTDGKSRPSVKLEPEAPIALNVQFDSRNGVGAKTISPGRYRVQVQSPFGEYPKSIRLGGEDFTRRPLDFTGGSAPLEVVLATDGGQVTGSVSDSQNRPLPAAHVSLWPVTRNGALYTGGALSTITGPDGSFTVRHVPPGEYYVASFENLADPGLATYFDFLTPFIGDAKRINVEPKGAVSMSSKPIPASTVKAAAERLP